MIRLFGTLGFVMLWIGDASACTIKANDLTERLSAAFGVATISVEESKDTRSGEPVRNYMIEIEGKGTVTVKQRHCEIYNLEISFLPSVSATDELGFELILRAAEQTPTWLEYFSHIDSGAVVQRLESFPRASEAVAIGLDDVIWARSASSEAFLEWSNVTDSEVLPSLIPVLYLGVGGL